MKTARFLKIFIVQFFQILMQALTNIQYELFMVLSTVGSFECDTYVHVILFLNYSKKLGTI